MACIFNESMSVKCPARAIMHNSESMEGLSMEAVDRDRNCQIFLLNLNCISNVVIYFTITIVN
jgi:hypothetical protein